VRWRRRLADPAQFEPVEPVEPVVLLVDDALRATSGRVVVSRSEAIEVLQRVEFAAHELPAAPRVLAIVDRVDRDCADQVLVPHQTMVDALLDVRSALQA
jgi:hypothetical protein